MIEDDVDLGADLRALLTGDRLAVAPAPGAAQLIVAGARRRRRRRAAALAGAVSVVAAIAAAGVLVTSWAQPTPEIPMAAPPSSPGAQPPATTTATTTATVEKTRGKATNARRGAVTRTVVVSGTTYLQTLPPGLPPVHTSAAADESTARPAESADPPATFGVTLGPGGYRDRLWLGMTFEQVQDSGALADPAAAPPEPGGCATYELAEGTDDIRRITVSADLGLTIFTAGGARSPEGMGLGSTRSDVEETYPNGERNEKAHVVATGSNNGRYFFMFADGPGADSKVTSFYLILDGQTCELT